ncbi:MAG TPA: pyrroline-5-carboxylate reductase [Thermoanaerobaculia bacterium]|nr:pyrroline-5-carboxylate reductase [Thermoanaerobaculia bacterium]
MKVKNSNKKKPAGSPRPRTIGFLGGGNMAEALVRGLLKGEDCDPTTIRVSAPRLERREELSAKYGVRTEASNADLLEGLDILILSVKPQIMQRVLQEIGERVAVNTLVISIAAGIPIAAIESALAPGVHVVRAMPNTPALVDAGATALARGGHASDDDINVAKEIFDAVGLTVILDEGLMDAVTGLSGSGPAYVFLILEALSDAGVKVGLSRRTSQLLAAQTLFGSAKLVLETGEHPGLLKDMVTSPGGTAITGLHTLEHGGVRTTLIDAVEAATRRSKELGKSLGVK